MALWRDPLDELIADLEHVVPAHRGPATLDLPSFEDVQQAVCPFLFGTAESQARAATDPRVQAVWKYFGKLGTICNRRAEAADRDDSSSEAERS